MAVENATFVQLLEIYQQSRNKGMEASLILETKNGKDVIHLTLGEPAGYSARKDLNWTPVYRRKKTPSQLKRDQLRKETFLNEKKKESMGIIKTEAENALKLPVDEINLEEIGDSEKKVYKIKGEFKDPNKKPWLDTEKGKKESEHEAFWKLLENNRDKIGFEDFSDGSTYVEHYLEFWGDLVVRSGITEKHLSCLENWPKGVRNVKIE